MNPNWAEILTPLLVPLVGYLAYLLQTWVKAHTAPQQFAALSGLASTAVEAVEQLSNVGTGKNLTSTQKYELAAQTVEEAAKRLGVKLDPTETSAFIHAAVKSMNDYAAQGALR